MHCVYLFDFDFTLADASDGIVGSFNDALTRLGYPAQDRETIRRTVGMTLPDAFALVTGERDPEKGHAFMRCFMEKADEIMTVNTRLLPGCVELLSFLKERGFATGIVSTKPRFRILDLLRRVRIESLIDVVVGYEDVQRHKPHPDALHRAMELLEASREEALYVGDTVIDAEAAKNAGVAFAAVTTGTTRREDFDPYPGIAVYSGLPELRRALEARL